MPTNKYLPSSQLVSSTYLLLFIVLFYFLFLALAFSWFRKNITNLLSFRIYYKIARILRPRLVFGNKISIEAYFVAKSLVMK